VATADPGAPSAADPVDLPTPAAGLPLPDPFVRRGP
jgi:hypothetical protein